jgi:hypothetical protein
LAPFLELHEKAPGVLVVILCDSSREGVAQTAVQQGYPPLSCALSRQPGKAPKSSLSWALRAE